jgi:very-short-patch-repair endonuclease
VKQDISNTLRDQANAKSLQIFRYLQALNQLRNPTTREIREQTWMLWLRELPYHPCIRRGAIPIAVTNTRDENGNQPLEEQKDETGVSEDFILKVKRPLLLDPPEPPRELLSWLQSGWQRIDGQVVVKPALPREDGQVAANGQTPTFRFEDNPQRKQLLEAWLAKRATWVKNETPAYLAMAVFEKLYALQAQIERESERLELMVGDGLLSWHPIGSNPIHHPVLLLRLELVFDPKIPEFTLVQTDRPPELYSALFQSVPGVNASALASCRDDLDQHGWHPLGGEDTATFFKRLVTLLSPYGEYTAKNSQETSKQVPRITRDPVLFLRNRTLGFITALESILEDLPERDDLPSSLTAIVGIDLQSTRQVGAQNPSFYSSPNGEDEHIFLSKPANAEQLEIARRLEKEGAVLVQGPPGTGKTHTIANLLGHLLAQGKSVLVTSHTAKALQVLREKVVEPLQPLCVSVLDDSTSREQMEQSVDAITERLASSNADILEREAAVLLKQRTQLLRQLWETRQLLCDARYDEYRSIVVEGKQYSPADAARFVKAHQATCSWIPASVAPGEPLPLSQAELVELYRTNVTVTAQEEQEIGQSLPDPDTLVEPEDFEHLIAERARLQQHNVGYGRELWTGAAKDRTQVALEQLQARINLAVLPLRERTGWCLAALAAGREGGPRRQAWEDLLFEIQSVYTLAAQAHPQLLKYNPFLPDDCLPGRVEKVLDAVIAHLKPGGNLHGMTLLMHREWKTLVEQARVQGRQPELLDHFVALRLLLQLKSARLNLLGRWQRQMVPLGGPDGMALGTEPERNCMQFVSQIRQRLDWYPGIWVPLERALAEQGFLGNVFFAGMPVVLAEYGELLRLRKAVTEVLPSIIAAEINRRALSLNESRLRTVELHIERHTHGGTMAEVLQSLLIASKRLDAQGYRQAFNQLVHLHSQRRDVQRRHELLVKLEVVAPVWAATIRDRLGVHGGRDLPGDPMLAWQWRQLQDELEARARTSLEDVQEQIARLSTELHQVTAELVEKRAWAAQARRTTLEQRQALQGWKAMMKKAGKGKGKRAPRLLASARQQMSVCQTAVPVWIMPLSRVVENFDPRRNRFDVVIIDEASQADVIALTAIYMGSQVVVVGDHEQVSPMAVGQNLDDIQYLIDEYLKGIPNKELYDGKFSIYELAQTTYEPICLREHFRCVSPIIQFSNFLSYSGKIKPLRDASEIRRIPHTVAYRVRSTLDNSHANEGEALIVASLLTAATEQPEYRGATFGVISMVSDEATTMRIDELLRRHVSTEDYVKRRIQCGNAAQFQGDERDVVFLSMVDLPSGNPPLPLRQEGADNMFKKRFNVAASRARDQMWVVHSMDPETDLKSGDIRRKLIEHAKDPYALVQLLESKEQQTESEFEKQVLRRLMLAGYRVIPQWPVGAYRIDLVVEGNGKRLAVECDGDRWHPREKLEEDMARQAILERLGWRFVRIRGSQFFRNPEQAMEVVFSRLQALDILPEGMNSAGSDVGRQGEELKERIVRRAAELRREWVEQGKGLLIPAMLMKQSWQRDNSSKNGAAASQINAVPATGVSPNPTVNISGTQKEFEPVRPVVQHISSNQALNHTSYTSDQRNKNGPPNVITFLSEKGLTVIDKRTSGGAIWVVGGAELLPMIKELEKKGIRFRFAQNGSHSTQNRPAWFTVSKVE